MEPDEPKGTVTLNPEQFLNIFIDCAARRLHDMRVVLRALDEPTYVSLANSQRPGAIIDLRVSETVKTDGVAERQTRDCFSGIFEDFMSFVDKLIAIQIIKTEGGIFITRPLIGEENIQQYIEQYVTEKIRLIEQNNSLTVPAKIAKFPITDDVKKIISAFNQVRIAIRHHQGIAKQDIALTFHVLKVVIGGKDIASLPAMAEAGDNISIRADVRIKNFKKGEVIALNEEDVEEMIFSLQTVVSPSLIALSLSNHGL